MLRPEKSPALRVTACGQEADLLACRANHASHLQNAGVNCFLQGLIRRRGFPFTQLANSCGEMVNQTKRTDRLVSDGVQNQTTSQNCLLHRRAHATGPRADISSFEVLPVTKFAHSIHSLYLLNIMTKDAKRPEIDSDRHPALSPSMLSMFFL